MKILVGNKSDLNSERQIGKTVAKRLAEKTGFDRYVDISAEQNINVFKTVEAIMNFVVKRETRAKELRATVSMLST